MKCVTLYENRSLYRDHFRIQGYVFGDGAKAVCVIGSMRGNEYQQLYICSQLVQALKKAEEENLLTPGYEIMVVPSVNPYSMNIEKRFWPIDNTDINRMFPGYAKGETTQRIAGGLFEIIQHYEYGIQFASNYLPGEFMPHVNLMRTGFEDVEKAKRFGMPYVVLRNPRPYDTATLNYNWQIWDTKAFSLYTTDTERINQESARRGVRSVMMFLVSLGYLNYHRHEGYLSQVIDDRAMVSVRAPHGGLLVPCAQVEQEVRAGELLAKIMNPVDGELLASVHAPVDGVVFFLHRGPLVYEHTAIFKLIPVE